MRHLYLSCCLSMSAVAIAGLSGVNRHHTPRAALIDDPGRHDDNVSFISANNDASGGSGPRTLAQPTDPVMTYNANAFNDIGAGAPHHPGGHRLGGEGSDTKSF